MAWAGGYVGDGVSTTNLAGRTIADLVLGRDTDSCGCRGSVTVAAVGAGAVAVAGRELSAVCSSSRSTARKPPAANHDCGDASPVVGDGVARRECSVERGHRRQLLRDERVGADPDLLAVARLGRDEELLGADRVDDQRRDVVGRRALGRR